MPLVELSGNMFNTDLGAVGQGVNTLGAMGAGVAVEFRRRFPMMYEDYRKTCEEGLLTPGGLHYFFEDETSIYNIASQRLTGRDATLDRLRSGTILALEGVLDRDEEGIALPRIGCGIGGLEWSDVRTILGDLADEYDTTVEVWTL